MFYISKLSKQTQLKHEEAFNIFHRFYNIALASCKNKKAEIVEAIKVSKEHVENGNTRLEAIQGIRDTEAEMIAAHMKFKHTPVDSLTKYIKLGIEENGKWEPVVDSLEMELKKY